MARSKPYQPLSLRLLHGLTALLVIGALITGFLVYDSWDGRFGRLGLTQANRELIDIHGTFGFFLFFIFIGFAIYSLSVGRQRLLQKTAFLQLAQIGKPAGWVGLQRLANTLLLMAGGLAVLSGKFQDENWLPNGEINHIWYFVHLAAWAGVLVALLLHVFMSTRVGGMRLLLSMVDFSTLPSDRLVQRYQHLKAWLQRSPR